MGSGGGALGGLLLLAGCFGPCYSNGPFGIGIFCAQLGDCVFEDSKALLSDDQACSVDILMIVKENPLYDQKEI